MPRRASTRSLPRRAYICSALTELQPELQEPMKFILNRLGDLCEEALGIRAFVPHEINDPVHHANLTPAQVDESERVQVSALTSVLIVVTAEPSWGGGSEVEMANNNNVPVVILRQIIRGEPKKISRLLLGNPAVKRVVDFLTYDDLFCQLRTILPQVVVLGHHRTHK